MKKTLIFACLFLFLSSFALASESFIISQIPQQLNAYSCNTGSTSFMVFDTTPTQQISTYIVNGQEQTSAQEIPIPSTFTVILTGEAATWTTAVPNRFTINSGEEQQINLFWNIPCDAGTAPLTITVQTDNGLARSFDTTLAVTKPQNLRLIPIKNSNSACLCESMTFQYIVQNTGDFTERYYITTDVAGARVNENPVILARGQSKTVSLYVDAGCDSYGPKQGTFTVSADGSGIVAETPFFMDILGCNNYNAYYGRIQQTENENFRYLNESYKTCEKASAIIPILFKNTGDLVNDYTLSVDKNAGVSTEALHLSPNEQKVVFIKIGSLATGQHSLDLHVITQSGRVESDLGIPVSVENCYAPTINIPNKIFINYTPQSNSFYILNTGTRKATYSISVYGTDWISVKPSTLSIESGQQGTFTITTNPGPEAPTGSYPISFIATTAGNQYQQDFTIVLGEQENTIVSALLLYRWYLLAGLGILVLLIAAIIIVGRQRKEAPSQEEAPIIEEQKIEKVYRTITEERKANIEAERARRLEEREAKKRERQAEVLARREERLEERRQKLEEKQKARIKRKPIWVTVVFIVFVLTLLAAMGYLLYKYYHVPQAQVKKTNVTGAHPSFTIVGTNETLQQPPQQGFFKGNYQRAKEWFWLHFKYIIIALVALVVLILIIVIYYKVKNKMMILWVIIGLLVIAGIIVGIRHLGPIVSKISKEKNVTNVTIVANVTETPVYTQDLILKELLNGKYGYDNNGNVVDTNTSARVSAQDFVTLLKQNSQSLVDSGIDEREINATISAFERMAGREQTENISTNPVENIPQTVNKTTGAQPNCTLSIDKDTKLTINLSHSFTDPDKDVLTYSAVESDNIHININGEMAEIVPKQGFVGANDIEFNARDDEGGSASSGVVTVCVQNPKQIKLLQKVKNFFSTYFVYIILGVIVLAVLIIAIRYYESRELPKPKKRR